MEAGRGVTEVVEAEVVTDLEPIPQQQNLSLFGTSDPVEVVGEATRVADALANVIKAKGLYEMIPSKTGPPKAHVRVEGWQLLGSMLGVTAVCTDTEAVDGGYRATVEARAADGRVIGRADALCTKHEKRGPWKLADDYARLSMAQTRATSKALKGPLGFVISLAGYQTTPAEEMTHAEPVEPPSAPESPTVDKDKAEMIEAAIKGQRLNYKQIDLLLGSAGLDALRARSPKALRERIHSLTVDEAAALEARFNDG